MFFFKHPQPYIRKVVAEQIVARKAQDLPETRVIVVDTAPAEEKPQSEGVGVDIRTRPQP